MERNSAEDWLIENIDRESRGELPPVIREAYPGAKKYLREQSIKSKDFVYLYGEENVSKDDAEVARLEAGFSHGPEKQAADVLEAIMLLGELNNWFGQNAETIKTSDFDDYINGVDMVVEFNERLKSFYRLGLAVDVTYSPGKVREKFERIKKEIEAGSLATIKYFPSEKEDFRGEKRNVPRVVVGIEWDTIAELAGLWERKEYKKLADHPAQRSILEEARLQLKKFSEYAKKIGEDDLATIFERDLAIIESILAGKKNIGEKTFSSDKIFQSIEKELDSFK